MSSGDKMEGQFIIIYNNGTIHQLKNMNPYLTDLFREGVIRVIIDTQDGTKWTGEKFEKITFVN